MPLFDDRTGGPF